MGEKTTRREFLRQMALSGVALSGIGGLGSAVAAAEPSGKSRVIGVTNAQVVTAEGGFAQAVLDKMVGQGIAKLAGAKSGAAGWKKYFGPNDVVGIKVNCLFGKGASTHPEVVNAVTAGLMMAGVKPENIIIWDRSTNDLVKCGFTINKDGKGPRCDANDNEWGETFTLGSFSGKLTKILTDQVTALVNVPMLKHHGLSGISCALKNHYGTINNPGSCHDGGCSPYLADINALAPIKDKTRLVVVDAIRPMADGGPSLKNRRMLWDYHSLLVSTDPAAIDYIGWQIIEEQRRTLGLKPLRQPANWLAAAAERGVGNTDPGKIDFIRI